MSHYYTTDNNFSSRLKFIDGDDNFKDTEILKEDYNNLSHIANRSIKDLVGDNQNLLIFPHDLKNNEDGISENIIFKMSGSIDELNKVKIETNNMMGFVGCGNTEISITSRFAKKSSEDFFLHYMLQKVMSINLFDMEHGTSRNNEIDFLFYVFPHLLKKAFEQGVYKTYQTFNKNDAAVKGVIDISRFIKNNNPFAGKIAYKSREHTAENHVMHLIRHTIEYIKTKPFGVAILSADKDLSSCIQTVYATTQNYNIREREKVILKNSKNFSHPYYTNYKPLIILCLSILRYKKLKYAADSKKVYGILFDGAWLWEEYLATILTKAPLNFIHPKNKTHENGINVYKCNLRYPDFYKGEQIEDNQNNQIPDENFILDAKYKDLKNGFNRDDLHQLVTYMHILPAKKGALIFPLESDNSTCTLSLKKSLYGLGGEIFTIGFSIPQNIDKLVEFAKKMKIVESEFINNSTIL